MCVALTSDWVHILYIEQDSPYPDYRDGETPGYAENPVNWNFAFRIGYIGSLQFRCYYLQYVPASKPFDRA